MVLSEVWD